jgi:hypothetical protein
MPLNALDLEHRRGGGATNRQCSCVWNLQWCFQNIARPTARAHSLACSFKHALAQAVLGIRWPLMAAADTGSGPGPSARSQEPGAGPQTCQNPTHSLAGRCVRGLH